MRYKRNQKHILFLAVLILGVMFFLGSAAAMTFDLGNETKLDCDVSLTYAAGWRVKDREMKSLAMVNPNYDDGGWNFDQWDMITNKGTVVADIDISHKNFGLFVRPKAFYDYVYMTDNSNPKSPKQLVNNAVLAGNDYDEWDDEVEDAHGANAEILDIFAYSSFDLGSRTLEVRVGRQVINWGESLYISGGISSAQSYLDLPASTSPGVELKEVYLPSGAVFAQMNLFENLAFSTYYQWEWQKHRFIEAGTFFNTADTLDETGFPLFYSPLAPPAISGEDNEPSDSGQYGAALHFRVDALNATEFGLYYCNYHEKWPTRVLSNLDPRNGRLTLAKQYWLDFAEDVKLYGASFSTEIADANIAGEISYHQDTYIRRASFYYTLENYAQAQISAIRGFSDPKYCDSSTFAGEAAINRVMGLENADLYYDKEAWGYRFTYSSTWYQIFQDLDLKVPISYTGNASGDSSVTGSFTEGADAVGYALEFTYKNAYLFNIRYTDYLNVVRNNKVDRDYLSAELKYTF